MGAADVFDDRGFNRNRDFFNQLPFEHIDPMTGNVLLTFTDLELPGNAGFNLRIQRTYNSKIFRTYPPSDALDEDTWAGAGWTLHMGRVANPFGAVPGPIEMPDGSLHRLYNHVDGTGRFITRDYWVYDPSANPHVLRLPNGMTYTMNTQTVQLGATTYLYTKIVSDPFGNQVTVNYMTAAGTPPDGILSIVQDLGGQLRTINFTHESTRKTLRTMTYSGRTWTYTQTGAYNASGGIDGTFSLLTRVDPPIGPPWLYSYRSTVPRNELSQITSPNGGVIGYTFKDQPFKLGSTFPVTSRALDQRSTSGVRDVPAGTSTYSYAQGTNQNQTVIDFGTSCAAQTYKETYTYLGIGNLANTEPPWRVGLMAGHTVTEGAATLESEANVWVQSDLISFDNESVGAFNASEIYVPLLQSRTVTRGSQSFVTTHTYHTGGASNLNDYGRPYQTSESGNRTTTRVFKYGFTAPYIVDRLESETVVVTGGGSFTRSYGYNMANGFKTSETVYGITTSYVPTSRGNVASRTDARSNTTSYTYESGQVKNIQTPEYLITRTINADGTVASETRRGFSTTFAYDSLMRPTSVAPAIGNPTTTTYDNSAGTFVRTARGTSFTQSNLDGFGRVSGTTNAVGVQTDTDYDACGRVVYQSYPFTATNIGATFNYDALGRVKTKTNPDSSQVSYSYTGIDVTVTDEENHATAQDFSAFGDPTETRLIQLTDPASSTTTYAYNTLGQITSVSMPSVPTRSWSYNSRGELVSETHPESGMVTYTYDAVGNVATRTDPAFGQTSFSYDGNDRLVSVNRPGTGYDLTIGYDDSDNRTSVSNGYVSSTFVYDAVNRLTSRTDTLNGRSFTTGYAYNGNDFLTQINYPAQSGRQVTFVPDAQDRIASVGQPGSPGAFASSFNYHPSGGVASYVAGNGLTHTVSHDNRYRVQTLNAGGVLALSYGYDDVGNSTSINESSRTGMNQSFAYDVRDRLQTANGFWGSGGFTYDASGNRLSKSVGGSTNYNYNSSTNRLSSSSGADVASYCYDANGNTTYVGPQSCPQTPTWTYTPTNMLESAAGTTYRYDGDGLRKLKTDASGFRYYVHGPGGQLLSEYEQSTGCSQLAWVRDYVYAGSRLLASVQPDAVMPSVSFVTGVASVSEGAGSVGAVVQLTTPGGAPLSCPVSVAFATANDSAQAPGDFTATSGILMFPAGTPNGFPQTISIALPNDTMDENNEDFSVNLSNPIGGALGAITTEVITIVDDDPEPSLSIGDVTMREGDGVSQAVFTVSLSASSAKPVTVNYATAPWTALAGVDYTSTAGTLTFEPQTTSQPINVEILGDRLFDGYEVFGVNLSSPSNATLPDTQALGILLDDDGTADFEGNYDGDGWGDILWYKLDTGDIYVWLMEEGTVTSQGPISQMAPASNWRIVSSADYNGDGRSDLLWRNWGSGEVYIWFMNGTTPPGPTEQGSVTVVSDLNWKVVGNGDYNGDGKSDILWRHAQAGEVRVWLMNGLAVEEQAVVAVETDLDWQIVGAGDYNGNGKSDILWHHALNGGVRVWLMDGLTVAGSATLVTSLDPHWQVVGSRDHNGDGMADLLWYYKPTGDLYMWFMSGLGISGSGTPPPAGDPAWEVVGTRRFNLDAKADILWRNRSSGSNSIWLMDGASAAGVAVPSVSDLNWRVTGAR